VIMESSATLPVRPFFSNTRRFLLRCVKPLVFFVVPLGSFSRPLLFNQSDISVHPSILLFSLWSSFFKIVERFFSRFRLQGSWGWAQPSLSPSLLLLLSPVGIVNLPSSLAISFWNNAVFSCHHEHLATLAWFFFES